MALNSRQKRTRKRKLALALLAKSRNPPMVATEGRVRSVWSKAMPTSARPMRAIAWEGNGKRGKSVGGKLVLARPGPLRFNAQPKGPINVDAAHAATHFTDTLRIKAARSRMAKINKE